MIPRYVFSAALAAAERGLLPDDVVRSGIRRLLRKRLQEIEAADPETLRQRSESFMDQCRTAPVAVATEAANEQHYEVPPEFFQLVLGSRRKYSCCEWTDSCSSLDEAEEAALATTCLRAELEDGMDILELGCGWGSLSLYIAEHFPNSRLVCVSNSQSQRNSILQQANERGLRAPEVITADMNSFSISKTFDRVVSVEMFEHMRNHAELLRRIATWLNPAGRLFVHLFCHRNQSYLFETRDESDWMARYFFTGGMMPAESLLLQTQDHMKVTGQWEWNGLHYQRTSDAWLNNMDEHRTDLRQILQRTYGADAAVWRNRWRLFFMACSELFGFRQGTEWKVAHYMLEKQAA